METGLAIVQNDNIMPALSPQEQVDKASEMARVLQGVVRQAHLARKFGGEKEHLYFEAWQTIARFFNCTPITEWTRPIMDGEKILGYEARVNVLNGEGRVIASAESMCMRDENNWRNKPLYALRSMAQTRTAGKALRSVFAWVAVLAGYAGTPAEEMSEEVNHKEDEIPNFEPPAEEVPTKGLATEKQRGMLYAKMKEAGLSKEQSKEFFHWFNGRDNMTVREASLFIDKFDGHLKKFREQTQNA